MSDDEDEVEEFSEELIHKTAARMFDIVRRSLFDGINWEDDDGNEDSKP